MRIEDHGSGNQVIGAPEKDRSLTITFEGNDNTVEIGPGCDIDRSIFNFRGSRQKIVLAGNNRLLIQAHLSGNGSELHIGARTSSNGQVWLNAGEPGDKVIMGEDCLFSTIRLRTSDSHPIYDLESGERINPSAPIIIGDRVWIAEDVLILKGAKIGNGAAIGARAVVVGEIPPDSLAVGVPARVVRKGIRWAEKLPPVPKT